MCLDADDYCPYENLTEEERRLWEESQHYWEGQKALMSDICDMFARTLLNELPLDTAVWKTSNTKYIWTAEELAQEVSNRTDIGIQYVFNVLRVARDIIKRKADVEV
jgi:hypothetical protein